MGKIRTRILGLEEVEEQQKKQQKEKSLQKKAEKKEKKVEVKEEKKVEKNKEQKEQQEKTKVSPKQKPRGKKYQQAKSQIDKNKIYSIEEAVQLLKKIKMANFDESVEIHLVVDETGLKGEVELPYSIGKTVRVAIVDDKILEKIEKGVLDFDVLVTHPSYMPKLAKYAKVLGPKGLMPNPKAGTISPNPEEVVKKFEKGVLRWKTEPKFPLIHQMLGKISYDDEKIIANVKKFIDSVGVKHIEKAYLKTTMSPSIKISL